MLVGFQGGFPVREPISTSGVLSLLLLLQTLMDLLDVRLRCRFFFRAVCVIVMISICMLANERR
jgi:hypothetical protein